VDGALADPIVGKLSIFFPLSACLYCVHKRGTICALIFLTLPCQDAPIQAQHRLTNWAVGSGSWTVAMAMGSGDGQWRWRDQIKLHPDLLSLSGHSVYFREALKAESIRGGKPAERRGEGKR
jgi:hypothetical protein